MTKTPTGIRTHTTWVYVRVPTEPPGRPVVLERNMKVACCRYLLVLVLWAILTRDMVPLTAQVKHNTRSKFLVPHDIWLCALHIIERIEREVEKASSWQL